MRRLICVLGVGSLVAGLTAVVAVPAAQAAARAGAAYTPLSTPVRVAKGVSLHSKKSVTTTLKGVPSSATAVLLTVSATGGSAAGSMTVFQTGTSRPAAGVDFAAGQTVANSVVVRENGGVASAEVYNGSARTATFTLAVAGYWAPAAAGQGSFGAVTPTRRLNTSTGTGAKGPLGAHHTVSFTVTGGSTGIPGSASAVLVDLTATRPTKPGSLTAFAASGKRPSASTMDFAAHTTLAHLAVVPVGAAGRVSVYNGSAGTVQVAGDVVGWFAGGDPTAVGALGVLTPYRVLSASKIGAHKTVTVSSSGRGGVPRTGVAALALNLRVASAAARGYLSVDPGSPVSTSNLNFAKGQSVANLVVARASGGSVRVYNGSSTAISVSVDVTGYVLGKAAPVPATSTSRYVRNITGAASDATTMDGEGRADCAGGSRLVLLDIGAQSNTTPTPSSNGVKLSKADPGVRLSATAVRLRYPTLLTALKGYLDGFAGCKATIAVSTSNDGDWTAYPAASKASDWASKVVVPLQKYAAGKGYTGESIVGASDIEASFASTAVQARAWVSDYLGHAGSSDFIENGSLDNCPSTYGSNAECGAVAGQTGRTWTRADYVQLTHGIAPGRIRALPQIYHQSQAIAWAELDRFAKGKISFAGALTEHASACGSECAFTPAEGWAALHHTLSTVLTAPSVPQVTDLRSDDAGAAQRRAAPAGNGA